MDDKPTLGISSCLLGQRVRYDGGHKLDRFLRDTLGRFVQWVPVCPETECGLPIPRESMHLAGDPASPRLVSLRSGTDHTDRMLGWIRTRLDDLEKQRLCGFVFKARSPSSGMRGIKVVDATGTPSRQGSGLFARAFMDRFPLLPVEDEGRLNDPGLRENFIERVFVVHRWHAFAGAGFTVRGLVDFHTDHKLLVMSHSPALMRELGGIVASAESLTIRVSTDHYLGTLMAALKFVATAKKNTNVLQHAMGYFKKILSADEKAELLETISNYHDGLVPLVVPVTLLNHYVQKTGSPYLKRQKYLHPHPLELMLRNHVQNPATGSGTPATRIGSRKCFVFSIERKAVGDPHPFKLGCAIRHERGKRNRTLEPRLRQTGRRHGRPSKK